MRSRAPEMSLHERAPEAGIISKERENANWGNYEGKFMLGGDMGETCGNVSSYYRDFQPLRQPSDLRWNATESQRTPETKSKVYAIGNQRIDIQTAKGKRRTKTFREAR